MPSVNAMKAGVHFTVLWSDEDVIELQIRVAESDSVFSNNIYVGHTELREAVARLDAFKAQMHGGLLDIRFGDFGPEYANGAFHARFHYQPLGTIHVSCDQETGFSEFGGKVVASRAAMFLKTEPVLLDRFTCELCAISEDKSDEAFLQAI